MPARVEGRRPNQSSAGRREAVTLLGQQPVADEHAGVVPIADAATVLCAASRDATRLVLSHTLPHGYLGSGGLRRPRLCRIPKWPREESNLRPQIRSLPLYPLSYGAWGGQYARGGLRRPLGLVLLADVSDEHAHDGCVVLSASKSHQLGEYVLLGERRPVRTLREHRHVGAADADDP